jgi:hypothetical protein
LAFAATYYLVAAGALAFLFPSHVPSVASYGMIAALVGAIMATYGYYLGHRRHVEDRVGRSVPDSLLRCPFVMRLLAGGGSRERVPMAPAEVALGETGRHG